MSLRRAWDKRVERWDTHVTSTAAFEQVRDRLLSIARNIARYGLRIGQEHPATPGFWQAALRDAGFSDVTFEPVIAEAGIVSAVTPA